MVGRTRPALVEPLPDEAAPARRRRRRRPPRSGRRKSQAARASSPGRSTPMWQRQITLTPGDHVWRRGRQAAGRGCRRRRRAGRAGQLVGGLRQRRLVDLALVRPQRSTVSLGLVQVVVDPLGDPEEVRVPGDRHPADVDAGAAGVGQERLEQLRDTHLPARSSSRARRHARPRPHRRSSSLPRPLGTPPQ